MYLGDVQDPHFSDAESRSDLDKVQMVIFVSILYLLNHWYFFVLKLWSNIELIKMLCRTCISVMSRSRSDIEVSI